ncbi:hypothetical protein HDU98_012144 [Podochytrium sp. JEL0797]|nr:hypothetical protein HDU98_012144 [Podochytrium sp. JEL0797]
MGYIEVGLNIFYTSLIACLSAALSFLSVSALWGKPAGIVLCAIFIHEILYCYCQVTLTTFSSLVQLDNYDIPFVIFTKFLECYSLNAFNFYKVLSTFLYMDAVQSTQSILSVKFLVRNKSSLNWTMAGISIASLASGILVLACQNSIFPVPHYLYLSSTEHEKLNIIIYTYNWSGLACSCILIIKWSEYLWLKIRASPRESLANATTQSTTKILFLSSVACTIQEFAICISVIAMQFVDSTKDPWLSILILDNVVSLPLDALLPVYFILMKGWNKGHEMDSGSGSQNSSMQQHGMVSMQHGSASVQTRMMDNPLRKSRL